MEASSMTWAIIWLWVEVLVWLIFQADFHGKHGLYFFIGMMVALGLQVLTILHIWWKNWQVKQHLTQQLAQAERALLWRNDPRNKDLPDEE